MQFLDSAGVRQFKQYNDSKYVVTEDVSTIDTPTRDTYTKDEIDEMLTHVTVIETDPIFTASAASGITSNNITSWNGKQDSISDLSTIRSGAALGATSVQTETDPVFSASAAAGITSSDITNWNSKTSNTGTITGITMNGASKGTSGVVDLGTVLTAHQDISGKADKSAAIGSLSLSLNSTDYKITLSGTKVDGTTFTVSDVIDLPLESVVVNGSYDDTTKKVVLTLKNGNTVDFSIADLIAGLQSEITSTNKLSADLIADGTTNKVVTATEKSTWNNKQNAITSTNKLDYSLLANTPTIPAAVTESTVSGWGFTKNTGTVTQVKVGNTSYDPSSGVVSLPAYPTSLPASDVSAWAKASSKPTYTASEVGALPSTTVIPDAANNATITIQKGGTTVDSFTVNASSNKTINIPNELPSYSSSDSGKILSVNSSGQLVWITPASIYSGSATPDANTGNNGDIYLQS